MNLKKYLSKLFIIRMCLLLAIVGGATVFDMVHASNQKLAVQNRKIPASNDTETNKIFFCNQVPSFNLKISTTELSARFRFAYTQDKFLIQHYNLRTFQLMKAETVFSGFCAVCPFHSIPFKRVLYASPDDTPPLA